MDKATKNKLNGTMIVPVGLAIVLVPYSLLLGWNGATLILFWLVLTPGLTVYCQNWSQQIQGTYLSQ